MQLVKLRMGLVQEFKLVSDWRAIALELALKESRIDWTGAIEIVAWRVLEEAQKQGRVEADVSDACDAVRIAKHPSRNVAAIDPASVEKTIAAVTTAMRFGAVAKIALDAQTEAVSGASAEDIHRRIAQLRAMLDEIATALA